jgi:hypothetical protein
LLTGSGANHPSLDGVHSARIAQDIPPTKRRHAGKFNRRTGTLDIRPRILAAAKKKTDG